jgi:hypothetical protein
MMSDIGLATKPDEVFSNILKSFTIATAFILPWKAYLQISMNNLNMQLNFVSTFSGELQNFATL